MTGRMDRYVGRVVLGSYGATLLFVVFLFMVIDLLVNMGSYVKVARENDLQVIEVLAIWLRFHVVSMPWIFVVLAPFVTVISCMFAVARLMTANEITPMLFCGRSMLRVLLPVITMALLSAALMAVAWEYVLPPLSRTMDRLAHTLDQGDDDEAIKSIVLFSPDRRQRLMCDRYAPELQRMDGVTLFDTGTRGGDLSELKALSATWNPEHQDWELQGGELICGPHTPEPRQWLSMQGVTPEILWLSSKDQRDSFMLGYSEIVDLIGLSPGRRDLVIALHYHLTWPLANLLLLLLALPFAVQFERGSKIGRTVLAVLICGSYLMMDLTFQNLGQQEWLHPVLAAWTPTIVFGSLGLVMFGGMRT